jgi:hypothetical protein
MIETLRPDMGALVELERITQHANPATQSYVRRHLAHCQYLEGQETTLWLRESLAEP